nr:hypothetical protein [Alphaproteobacteria bacterium]
MNREIDDVFTESENLGRRAGILTSAGSDLHVMTSQLHDSECFRISSLSEVFLEWYLFDSSTEKNIKIFLETEGIADVFTENEFMDLLCGKACLDDTLVEFVALKLPFSLTLKRLGYLNFRAQTRYIPVIKSKSDLIDKIREIFKQQKQQAHDKTLERDRQRYKRRRDAVVTQKKEYYNTHKEEIAKRGKIYRAAHKNEIKARKQLYWE